MISQFLAGHLMAQQLDPTKPLKQMTMSKESIKQHFRLYSIIKNNDSLSAIINDKTLMLGDKIGAYTAISINANQVILSNTKETIELSLFSNDLIK